MYTRWRVGWRNRVQSKFSSLNKFVHFFVLCHIVPICHFSVELEFPQTYAHYYHTFSLDISVVLCFVSHRSHLCVLCFVSYCSHLSCLCGVGVCQIKLTRLSKDMHQFDAKSKLMRLKNKINVL